MDLRPPLARVFARDHRSIGLGYFFLSLFAVFAGIVLSLFMRFHMVNPAAMDSAITPEFYLSLLTLHGTLMIFFVLTLAPQSAFGNLFFPAQLGASEMAFPRLNALSLWLTGLSLAVLFAAFLAPGGGPISGWTAYPPLSAVGAASGPGEGYGQTLWLVSLAIFSLATLASSVNFITTAIEHRPARPPLTCVNWFVTAVLSLLAFSVLLPATLLLLMDRLAGTSFFLPGNLLVADQLVARGGGSPLLWQHLFWFFGHPEVYIAILPGMGMVSAIIANFSGREIFGYRGMVLATFSIAVLGFLIWGHHMFISGLSPYSGIAFSVLTLTIAVPSSVKTFNWIATIWSGETRQTTAMLFALGFVSVFITGGLSGIVLGQPVLDQYFHDTTFVVAHFHMIMGVAAIFAIFAATFYWFPLMFGRMLDERLGKLHFFLTFAGAYAIFLPMHFTGFAGNPRRYADLTTFQFLGALAPLHQWMTWAAYFTAAAQLIFLWNFVRSIRRGELAPSNPWNAGTLEWLQR